MRVKTLEIRWHDSRPINACDFQPVPPKRARPPPDKERDFAGQSYRLATAGEDNNVRLWMVYPNILPASVAAESGSSSAPVPHPPRVEYLATLAKHQASVNVVRWSPNGELIASAGDDGMVIVWSPSSSAPAAAFGQDPEELTYEKEFWKARTPFRCTTMQVYDLAWSPTGEYLIAGSTDNTARIFTSADGKCIREIAEHSHYVQGVAWDPLNEYIATQSSDRAVHVYSINAKHGPAAFDCHAIGRNTKMSVRSSRTPSVSIRQGRPRVSRRESAASDCESAAASDREENMQPPPLSTAFPLTPAPSIASTSSASGQQAPFLPPPADRTTSRRSSFSSVAPGSPTSHYSNSQLGRSPSPMPPLPAIRAPPSPQLLAQSRLYGDESFTNFYRRLTFSPDGGLLLTPSGHFEDSSNIASLMGGESFSRGRRGHPADSNPVNPVSESSVYIYSRASFARPPIAQLPGHKKASIAVEFSPVLYELRPHVIGPDAPPEPRTANIAVEKNASDQVEVEIDMVGPLPLSASVPSESPSKHSRAPSIVSATAPSPSPVTPYPSQSLPSPALSAVDGCVPQTPSRRAPTPTTFGATSSESKPQSGSIFALPYRMLFAVATMDAVTIHDTQQASPIALLTKLHYDEFTDMAWSPDGQCLLLTSRDGYCTLVIFDQILPLSHTQQNSLQLQSIAMAHQHSHSHSHSSTSMSVHGSSSAHITPSPTPAKRSAPLPSPERPILVPTPASASSHTSTSAPLATILESAATSSSITTSASTVSEISAPGAEGEKVVPAPPLATAEGSKESERPKKKRRVELTRVGDVNS